MQISLKMIVIAIAIVCGGCLIYLYYEMTKIKKDINSVPEKLEGMSNKLISMENRQKNALMQRNINKNDSPFYEMTFRSDKSKMGDLTVKYDDDISISHRET